MGYRVRIECDPSRLDHGSVVRALLIDLLEAADGIGESGVGTAGSFTVTLLEGDAKEAHNDVVTAAEGLRGLFSALLAARRHVTVELARPVSEPREAPDITADLKAVKEVLARVEDRLAEAEIALDAGDAASWRDAQRIIGAAVRDVSDALRMVEGALEELGEA